MSTPLINITTFVKENSWLKPDHNVKPPHDCGKEYNDELQERVDNVRVAREILREQIKTTEIYSDFFVKARMKLDETLSKHTQECAQKKEEREKEKTRQQGILQKLQQKTLKFDSF